MPIDLESLLSNYGLRPAPVYDREPVLFGPNSGFAARHPGFASGIENAFIAAANTPSGATAGDSISNIFRGVLGIGPYREQRAMQRMSLPFQMASQMAGLQKMSDEHDMAPVDMRLKAAQAGYYEARPDIAMERINATRPVVGSTHDWVYRNGTWEQTDEGSKPTSPAGMGGFKGRIIEGQLGPPPPPGHPLEKKYWENAGKLWVQYAGAESGARAGGSFYGTPGNVTKQDETNISAQRAALQKTIDQTFADYILSNPTGDLQGYSKLKQEASEALKSLYPPATPNPVRTRSQRQAPPGPGNPFPRPSNSNGNPFRNKPKR